MKAHNLLEGSRQREREQGREEKKTHHSSGEGYHFSRQGHSRLGGEEVDGPGPVAILLDEATVVLCAWGRVDGRPAVLAVVTQAVDVATEVGGVAPPTVESLALVTRLVVQDVGLDFNLPQ